MKSVSQSFNQLIHKSIKILHKKIFFKSIIKPNKHECKQTSPTTGHTPWLRDTARETNSSTHPKNKTQSPTGQWQERQSDNQTELGNHSLDHSSEEENPTKSSTVAGEREEDFWFRFSGKMVTERITHHLTTGYLELASPAAKCIILVVVWTALLHFVVWGKGHHYNCQLLRLFSENSCLLWIVANVIFVRLW